MRRVLLLSGGLDSTCLAAWLRPEHCLGVDYGQRAAEAENRAASAVARELDLPYSHVRVDTSAVGGGVMAGEPDPGSEAPEWWPFRNQFLITVAAGWCVVRGYTEILVGTVLGDGARHADGRQAFYDSMSTLLQVQEGGLVVTAPGIGLSAPELIEASGVSDGVLGWTHSCHAGNLPCWDRPGCAKRAEVLAEAGRWR